MENNKETFVRLWQKLEHTRREFRRTYRRYCIRRVVQAWVQAPTVAATDPLIAALCVKAEQRGYDELPPSALNPYPARAFLHAWASEQLGIGMREVNLRALDAAYNEAFPHGMPLNMARKGR